MKASELIEKLQAAIAEHGDMPLSGFICKNCVPMDDIKVAKSMHRLDFGPIVCAKCEWPIDMDTLYELASVPKVAL